ncbi:MAG: phage tail tape measure protein [Cyanobacteria bacterium P01_D01_bin.36]
MTINGGNVEFGFSIDQASINRSIARVENSFRDKAITLNVEVNRASLSRALSLTNETFKARPIKVNVEINRASINTAAKLTRDTISNRPISLGVEVKRSELRKAERVIKTGLQDQKVRITPQVDTKGVDGLKQGIRDTSNEAGRLDSILAGFSGAAAFIAIDAAIAALRATVVGLVGVLSEAVTEFGRFEQSLNSFASRAQGTGVDLQSLEDEIKSVAQATSFTPAELGDASTQLVALGTNAADVEGRLLSLAQTADVLGEDPVITGRVVQGALEQYEEFGETADSVSDILVKLINTTAAGSRSGIAEFEQLFSRAAPTARALGIELETLVSAFAGLRQTGATAQVASSTIDAVLTRIATERDTLEQEGISVQFDAQGGVDFVATLEEIRERINTISNPTDQVDFLAGLFGRERGGDVLALINSLDGAFGSALENANNASGELGRTFEIVSQGIIFQAGILQGQYKTALTEIGGALAPVAAGFIELAQGVFEATSVDLSSLSDSADRLGIALGDNPQLVERLGQAFSVLGQTAADELAKLLDQITELASNEDAIENLGETIEFLAVGVGNVIRVASVLVDIFEDFAAEGNIQEQLLNRLVPGYQAFSDAINFVKTAFEFLQRPIETVKSLLDDLLDRLDFFGGEGVANVREFVSALNSADIAAAGSGGGFGDVVTQGFGNIAAQANVLQRQGQNLGGSSSSDSPVDTLEDFRDEQDALLSDIELRATQTETLLAQQGAAESAVADAERASLNERLAARQAFLSDLQSIDTSNLSGEEAANVASEIRNTEQAIANDRLAIERSLQRQRVEAAQEAADEVIDQIERQRNAQSEAAQDAFDDQTRDLNTEFDQGAEQRAIANEEQVNAIKEEGERRVSEIKEQTESDIQAQRETFENAQQSKRKRFEEELNDIRDRESSRIDAAASEAEFQTSLRLADSEEERQELRDERAAAEERARILAEEQEKALGNIQEGAELTPIEQARLDLENEIEAKQAEFQAAQQAEQKAFEDEVAAQEKATANEVAAIEKATADEIQTVERAFAETERQIEEDFEDRMRDRERQFREDQRRLDEDSARRIEQIRDNAARGIAPQSLRSGGVVQGDGPVAPVQVHKDEFMLAPVGTRVISQAQSRQLVKEQLEFTRPTINLPSLNTASISQNFDRASSQVAKLASDDRKLMRVLEDIRDNALLNTGGIFNISTSKPEIDIAYLERMRFRSMARRGGF